LTPWTRLLRAGLAGQRIVDLNDRMLSTERLFIFVEDMSWALMLLVTGSPYRALHLLQTDAFPVPMGFNTPVKSDHWMSYGPLSPPINSRGTRESHLTGSLE
jgi:hypothetical protein